MENNKREWRGSGPPPFQEKPPKDKIQRYPLRKNPKKTEKYSPSSTNEIPPKKEPKKESPPKSDSESGEDSKKDSPPKSDSENGESDSELEKMTQQLDDLLKEFKNLSVKMSKPKMPPFKQFQGRSDPRTFQAFIREFNKMGSALSWSEEEMTKMLPLYLSENEQVQYDSLPDATKKVWKTLVDELAKRFSVESSVPHYRRLAILRRQRVGESPAEFAIALKNLVDKAFPDAQGFTSNMRDNMTIDYFRNGLKMNIREAVRHLQKPKDLTEAIMQATEEEEMLAELMREKLASAQVEQVAQINQITPGNPRIPIRARVQFLPNRRPTPYNRWTPQNRNFR